MSSSMRLLNNPISKHGLVVIVKQQVSGIGKTTLFIIILCVMYFIIYFILYITFYLFKKLGRGGNKWLSPNGCAMFSIQLHIPLESKLGQRLALLQHVIALSIVSGICSLPGGYNVRVQY